MNSTPDTNEIKINAIEFNNDDTLLCVSTDKGFRIYSTELTDCAEEEDVIRKSSVSKERIRGRGRANGLLQKFDYLGPIKIAKCLFRTPLCAIVGNGGTSELSPRRVKILNADLMLIIKEMKFQTTVVDVLMNRHVLCVRESERVSVYELISLQRIVQIPLLTNDNNNNNNNNHGSDNDRNNNNNQRAKNGSSSPSSSSICALNADANNEKCERSGVLINKASYLACQSNLKNNAIVVYDLLTISICTEIENAHDGAIKMLALSQKGNILASCSIKGTVIRTWDIPSGEPRNVFRRGSMQAEITSLRFAYSSSTQSNDYFKPELLAVASDSGTAHVFQCFKRKKEITHEELRQQQEEKSLNDDQKNGEEEENNNEDKDKDKEEKTTTQKILHVGGMLSKFAFNGAKKVTASSVSVLSKVSQKVLKTSGISDRITKSFLEPKRAVAVIKLPAHKRTAAARNENFAIGLGSGESNVQVDVMIKHNNSDNNASSNRIEWNVVTIRPFNEENNNNNNNNGGGGSSSTRKNKSSFSSSSASKKQSTTTMMEPPSLNPADYDKNDDDDDDDDDINNGKDVTKKVRVICASSNGTLLDYRVRLRDSATTKEARKTTTSSSSSKSLAADDDDVTNNTTKTTKTNGSLETSDYSLEREFALANSQNVQTITGFSTWTTAWQRQQQQQQQSNNDDRGKKVTHASEARAVSINDDALRESMMRASQMF